MNKAGLGKFLVYLGGWLDYRYRQETIPGFVVAVACGGEVLFNEAYGYADLEKKTKMNPQHIFRIASHSKTFTATAVMQLQEQGKLKIDDKIVKYLPWLKKNQDKRWQKVTIRQLLSHGAGMIRDGLEHGYWSLERPFPDKARFQKEVMATDLMLDNNIKLKYSNYGYTLLGLLIEAVSGQPYNEYVSQRIIKPLALENTTPEINQSIEKRLATGYTREDLDHERLPIDHVSTNAMSPATGFCSTAADLCKFFSAQIIGSGQLLSDKSKTAMQMAHWKAEYQKDKEEYGLGLEIEYPGKRRVVGHSGGFPGFATKSLFLPDEKIAIVVLTNAMLSGTNDTAHGLVKTLDYFLKNVKDNPKFDRYQGRFLSLWAQSDLINLGNKLAVGDPGSWEPFERPDELKHQEAGTFKIVKTNSFMSEGELVHFKFANDKVQSILYGGDKLLPEKIYLQQLAKKNRITLE